MNTKTRSGYGCRRQSETQRDFRAKTTVPSTRCRIQRSLLMDRRGATLVEFALVLPLLMLILLGCLDFGRILYVDAIVTNTANEGAAWGSLNPPTSGGWNQGVVSAAWECQCPGANRISHDFPRDLRLLERSDNRHGEAASGDAASSITRCDSHRKFL
jgi:Flp pilus assembly pilin Flp